MSIKFNFSFFLLFFFPPLGHYLLLVLIWSDSMTTTSLWSHSTREMNRIILYDVVINKSDYSWRDYIYIYLTPKTYVLLAISFTSTVFNSRQIFVESIYPSNSTASQAIIRNWTGTENEWNIILKII